MNLETGVKELYSDHYVIPNNLDPRQVKEAAIEWLKRMFHKPDAVEKEFFIIEMQGVSIPFWVVSLESHTAWKGLVKKHGRGPNMMGFSPSDFLTETGQFRRSYRWAVSARKNICETWGLMRLHEPKEDIPVEWDGFPFDSTFSRGHMFNEPMKAAYDVREFFDFKYANGMPLLGIQVPEEEALRRARAHVQLFHYKIASLNAEYLIDHRTELDIAGIQLIHVPFWHIRYVYRPQNTLRYLHKPKEKNILMDGYARGILRSELALVKRDKVQINGIAAGVFAVLCAGLGVALHPAFYVASVFGMIVSAVSMYISSVNQEEHRLMGGETVLRPSSNKEANKDAKSARGVA